MTKPRYFGTDGLRGVANTGMLTPEVVVQLGRAVGRLARENQGRLVALARDPRRSSPFLAAALASGVAAEGVDVLDLGVLPTPAIAALLPTLNATLGAVISASHNPMQDNGIKILTAAGTKLEETAELWLEEQMQLAPVAAPVGAAVGDVRVLDTAVDRYIEHLLARFPALDLSGMKIVFDGANGATCTAGPRLLAELGAEVVPLCCEPDGVNINDGCGAVHPERMARVVVEEGADAGVAADGDGDRAIFASSDGSIQDGDRILYIYGRSLLEAGRLTDKVIVGTVMSNFGLELALAELGARLVRTPVGDRHVAVELRRNGWLLGGEQSGHLIFGDDNAYIGDGLFSALKAFEVMKRTGRHLHELSHEMPAVPQVLLNVPVRERPPVGDLPTVAAAVSAAEQALAGSGRVLVRYSGTECLLRVMVEGRDEATVRRTAAEIAEVVRQEIGSGEAASP